MIVSSKGQIVIPKRYRDRLRIEPGMEVTVRIRGQFLLVEIDTDIQADIDHLNSLKGKLGEEDCDMTAIEDILRDLINQQFFKGEDILTDRINQQELKIRGSGSIINQVIKILAHASRHWLEGKYTECIREFADSLDLDFPALLSKYVTKIKTMLPGGDLSMVQQMGGEILYTMVVSTTLTHFREKVGDMVTERLIKRAEEMGYIEKYGDDEVEEMVTKYLAEEYSILMNLRTLREFARTSVKFVGRRHFNIISERMLDDMKDPEASREEKRKLAREERMSEKSSPTLPVQLGGETNEAEQHELPTEPADGENSDEPDLPDFSQF